MGRLILILGGARSGKSEHAQRLAMARPGTILFIATAQPLDDEMQQRIAAHRQDRPPEWETLELPTGVGKYLAEHGQSAGTVLLDCLTLLVSNIMLQFEDGVAAREAMEQEIGLLLQAIHQADSQWIVVSNEVGQGIVPAYAMGRQFRDLLGWANKEMARRAAEVIWMVAGIPVPITDHRVAGT